MSNLLDQNNPSRKDDLGRPSLEETIDFSLIRHGNYKWGPYPFFIHLDRTHRKLTEYGLISEFYTQVAWLHDILEYTDTTKQELLQLFPTDIVVTVISMTHTNTNRAISNHLIHSYLMFHPEAIYVKLAERIVNTELYLINNDPKLELYKREFLELKHVCLTGCSDVIVMNMLSELSSKLFGRTPT